MTMTAEDVPRINVQKAPFPWFGGKSNAAELVWSLLGDPAHYVEPFAGSIAVLLNRSMRQVNRPYFSETVNDVDGLLVNAWRAIQAAPDETARHASWPVSELDLHARHCALIKWRAEEQADHLAGDPDFFDARMAGWWLWGISSWIGGEWCAESHGPWWPDEEGRLRKRDRKRPAGEPGVRRRRSHLRDDGKGVNRPQMREPGVTRKLPYIGNTDGKGVNHAGTREPGVGRKRPHLGNNGQGVNHAGTREPGTEFHDITMPQLVIWFRWLSARLRHVRVLQGDWKRTLTRSALYTLSVDGGKGPAGVLLDPPYADSAERDGNLYGDHDSGDVAHEARAWAIAEGDNPKVRIAFCGYEGEHGDAFERAGWTGHEWFKSGFLSGGMANISGDSQQGRERIWASPHCLNPAGGQQADLFGQV